MRLDDSLSRRAILLHLRQLHVVMSGLHLHQQAQESRSYLRWLCWYRDERKGGEKVEHVRYTVLFGYSEGARAAEESTLCGEEKPSW